MLRDWAHVAASSFRDLGARRREPAALGRAAAAGLTSLGTISAFALLIFFFTLLMLLEARAWRRKTEAALRASRTQRGARRGRQHRPQGPPVPFGPDARRADLGRRRGLWLWLLGVDFAVLWGLLFFLLNYVPNIGSLIAGIPPTILAFMQLGLGWAMLAVAGLLAIDQVIGNYLDPRLQGRTLNISSLVVLISVILWGWIWGVVGTLLAVPMTVLIISVCERVPALQPVAILLQGGRTSAAGPA